LHNLLSDKTNDRKINGIIQQKVYWEIVARLGVGDFIRSGDIKGGDQILCAFRHRFVFPRAGICTGELVKFYNVIILITSLFGLSRKFPGYQKFLVNETFKPVVDLEKQAESAFRLTRSDQVIGLTTVHLLTFKLHLCNSNPCSYLSS